MSSQNRSLGSGEEEAFSPISRPTLAPHNAYNQPPPVPGQAILSHRFLPTINGSPPVSVNSELQFNEPFCNNIDVKTSNHPSHANTYVRHDRPPPKFNLYARPNGPPPFSNANQMLSAPVPFNFNTKYNYPPRFSYFSARPDAPPPHTTFRTICNRPPPFVDTNGMANRPPFQTNSHDGLDKFSVYEPSPNSFSRPPFPGNFNVRLQRPPPSQVCFDNKTRLPPPNSYCHSSEFKTRVLSNENYSSNNIENATCYNNFPSQEPPLSSDGLIPLPRQFHTSPFLPPTSNLSFPTVTSFQPTLGNTSTLPSQSTSGCEQSPQPFQASDCYARPLTTTKNTLQHQQSLSHVGLLGSRNFTKDQSCHAVPSTSFEAVPSCSAPSPSRHNKAEGNFSDTTRTTVTSALVIPFHPFHQQVISFKKDQEWVNKWLGERGKLQMKSKSAAVSTDCSKDCADRGDDQINKNKTDGRDDNKSKLADVHSRVAKYTELLEKLRQCHHTRNEEKRASVKVELDVLSSQLLDPCYQSAVQRLVAARRKKRARAKHSRQVRLERWQARSKDIDRQRELLCNQYKAEERQKLLVAEADAVLHEVRGKKEETVSLQLLLAALRDLRQHRLNRGDQQGFVATQHHTEHFEKVTEGLDEMLESQLQDYELEERTLRAMLDQQRGSNQLSKVLDAARGNETSYHKTQITFLGESLFACAASADPALLASYTAANTSREMLLSRRRAWDKYLVEVGGSGIPIFWVTPPEKPSGGWEKWSVQS